MKYFTIKKQLFLVPTLDIVKEYEKIDKFMKLLENSGVGKIIEYVKLKNNKCKGRNGYNPYNLFATIIYCFSKFKGTLRDIEDKCIFDVRVRYIMEGKTPDYSSICLFINEYILPFQYEIFTLINKQIIKELDLNIDDIYNDGTKFEANANKYKFVWKPTKFHQKLDNKIRNFILVKNGLATKLISGTSSKQKDSREELTEDLLNDEEEIFKGFFESLN